MNWINLVTIFRTAFVPLPYEKQRPIKHESELHLTEGEIESVSAYRAEYNKKHIEKQHGYVYRLKFCTNFFISKESAAKMATNDLKVVIIFYYYADH